MGMFSKNLVGNKAAIVHAVDKWKVHKDTAQTINEIREEIKPWMLVSEDDFLDRVQKLLSANSPDRALRIIDVLREYEPKLWVVLALAPFHFMWKARVAVVAALIVLMLAKLLGWV